MTDETKKTLLQRLFFCKRQPPEEKQSNECNVLRKRYEKLATTIRQPPVLPKRTFLQLLSGSNAKLSENETANSIIRYHNIAALDMARLAAARSAASKAVMEANSQAENGSEPTLNMLGTIYQRRYQEYLQEHNAAIAAGGEASITAISNAFTAAEAETARVRAAANKQKAKTMAMLRANNKTKSNKNAKTVGGHRKRTLKHSKKFKKQRRY